MKRSNFIRATLLSCGMAIALQPGAAQAEEGQTAEAAAGVGAALTTLVYAPLKITYAGLFR